MAVNWSKDKSVLLSQICVAAFAALLLALDAGCWRLARWFAVWRLHSTRNGVLLAATVWICSVFGWVTLVKLWRLLGNLRRGEVFVLSNVSHLRAVSWCCACVSIICLGCCLYYLPFIFVAAAAGFMALIVRIVKNVFQQACAMQSELDLTI